MAKNVKGNLGGLKDDTQRTPVNFNNLQHKYHKASNDSSADMGWEEKYGVALNPLGVWGDTSVKSPQQSYSSPFSTAENVGIEWVKSQPDDKFDSIWEKKMGTYVDDQGVFKDQDMERVHEIDLKNDSSGGIGLHEKDMDCTY